MDKPKGKGDKGKRLSRRKGQRQPGVLLSWEDWSEEAMREYLDAIVDDLAESLDEQEQALRGRN